MGIECIYNDDRHLQIYMANDRRWALECNAGTKMNEMLSPSSPIFGGGIGLKLNVLAHQDNGVKIECIGASRRWYKGRLPN